MRLIITKHSALVWGLMAALAILGLDGTSAQDCRPFCMFAENP